MLNSYVCSLGKRSVDTRHPYTHDEQRLIDSVIILRTNAHQLLNKMKIRHVLLFCICLLFPLRSLAKRSSCSGMQSEGTLLGLGRLFGGSSNSAKISNLLAGICGKAKESPKSPPAEGSTPKDPEEDERIVNGWDAPARPFLALIRAVDPKDADSYETCGGAVLNR